MNTPAWLIPALRAALRVAVRWLSNYEESKTLTLEDLQNCLYTTLIFTPHELDQGDDAFVALLNAKIENLRHEAIIKYAQRTLARRKLTNLDIPL